MSWVCWIFNLQAVNPQSMPLGFSWLVCVCVLVLSTQPAGAPETVTVEFLLVGLRGYQFPLVNSSGYLPVNISGVLDQDLFSRSLRNVSAMYPGIFKGRVYISRATRNKTVVTSHRCSAGYFSPAGVGCAPSAPQGRSATGWIWGAVCPAQLGSLGSIQVELGRAPPVSPAQLENSESPQGGWGRHPVSPAQLVSLGPFQVGLGRPSPASPVHLGSLGSIQAASERLPPVCPVQPTRLLVFWLPAPPPHVSPAHSTAPPLQGAQVRLHVCHQYQPLDQINHSPQIHSYQ